MSTEQSLDILAFIADDRFGITYKPRWNAVTGSMAASILLQQIVYRWAHSGRRAFYKFTRPCGHRLYRAGDSWEEELDMKRREFENARSAIAVRTRGEIAPNALVSYWVDAQRVTWYVLNEANFLQRFATLYPSTGAGAGIQLPLPDPAAQLMDETCISSIGRNVHQPATELMDETCISSNAPKVHQLVDETSIRSDGRNVHPLYTENNINQQKAPKTTTASSSELPPPPVAVADVNPLPPILAWIDFEDALTPKERTTLDAATLLAWAYWIKLTQTERASRIHNPVGLVRAQWRKGNLPRADLLRLARGWMLLDDARRALLLGRLEWSVAYGPYDPGEPLDDEFPDIPLATAAAVYSATGGELGPSNLMPPRETIQPPSVQESRQKAPKRETQHVSALWPQVLAELEMQMARTTYTTWLKGTTAAESGNNLTIIVRNEFAVEWLSNRLHPVIERTVAGLAGRPISIHYEVSNAI